MTSLVPKQKINHLKPNVTSMNPMKETQQTQSAIATDIDLDGSTIQTIHLFQRILGLRLPIILSEAGQTFTSPDYIGALAFAGMAYYTTTYGTPISFKTFLTLYGIGSVLTAVSDLVLNTDRPS